MNRHKTIQFKAALLLLVFSFNTLLGFGCSLGLNMGYNAHHHDAEAVLPNTQSAHHEHGSEKQHHEDKKQHNHDSENSNDDCCSDGVTSFNLLNKTVSQQVQLVHPGFTTIYAATWFDYGMVPYNNVTRNIKPFVRSHHPPIPDIRIAIQSFQI